MSINQNFQYEFIKNIHSRFQIVTGNSQIACSRSYLVIIYPCHSSVPQGSHLRPSSTKCLLFLNMQMILKLYMTVGPDRLNKSCLVNRFD
jgi:hypothetical protein